MCCPAPREPKNMHDNRKNKDALRKKTHRRRKTHTGELRRVKHTEGKFKTLYPPFYLAAACYFCARHWIGKKKFNRLLIELNIENNKKIKDTYLAVHSEGKLYPGCHIFWTAARLEFNIIYLTFYIF